MLIIQAKEKKCIDLGRRGENRARKIVFDISDLTELYGQGEAHIVAQRDRDLKPYPVEITQDNTTVTWVVTSVDNDQPGYGQCELVYITDGSVVKSIIYQTHTDISLSDPVPPSDSPDIYGDIIARLESLEDEEVDLTGYATETFVNDTINANAPNWNADGITVGEVNGVIANRTHYSKQIFKCGLYEDATPGILKLVNLSQSGYSTYANYLKMEQQKLKYNRYPVTIYLRYKNKWGEQGFSYNYTNAKALDTTNLYISPIAGFTIYIILDRTILTDEQKAKFDTNGIYFETTADKETSTNWISHLEIELRTVSKKLPYMFMPAEFLETADKEEILTRAEELVNNAVDNIDFPENLPNPNTLHLTGAVEATYDGSEAVEVEIPQGGEQPDWNQNDSTAKDYVKNRPFYHDVSITTLAETEVLQGNRSYALPSAEYVYGDEYIIEINGEKYTMSLSWQYNYYDANYLLGFNLIHGMTVYGGVKPASSTFHLYGWGENLFYDEPAKGDRFNFVLHAYVNKSSGITLPASVKILKEEQELRTIDKKYLPAEYLEPSDKEEILAAIPVTEPLLLNADMAETYLNDSSYGDAALEAIKNGREILVRVPNADGGSYTAIYSPVLMHQVPNYQNNYLYLFFLRDEKQDLSSLLGLPAGSVMMPTYGQLKMLLSQEYNSNPLE